MSFKAVLHLFSGSFLQEGSNFALKSSGLCLCSFIFVPALSLFVPFIYHTCICSLCSIKKCLLNRVSPLKSFICINLSLSFLCRIDVFH
jgi:hypothetical protein